MLQEHHYCIRQIGVATYHTHICSNSNSSLYGEAHNDGSSFSKDFQFNLNEIHITTGSQCQNNHTVSSTEVLSRGVRWMVILALRFIFCTDWIHFIIGSKQITTNYFKTVQLRSNLMQIINFSLRIRRGGALNFERANIPSRFVLK